MAHMFQTIFWNVFFIKYICICIQNVCSYVSSIIFDEPLIYLHKNKASFPTSIHSRYWTLLFQSILCLTKYPSACLSACVSVYYSVDPSLHAVHCCVITHACLPWSDIWWAPGHHQYMMTSSNGNIFRVTGPLFAGNSPVPGEFPVQMPVTRSFDIFFDLCLNKRLSKQRWGWWFERPSRPLWRHCNERCRSFNLDRTHLPYCRCVGYTIGVWTTGVSNCFDDTYECICIL